jgi:hypothetical protein
MGALALFGAGVVIVPIAWAIQFVACDELGPSEACDRQQLANIQLGVALVALVPGSIFVWHVWRKQRRRALVSGALVFVAYFTWALLADAAVHGWDELRLLGH